MKVRVLALVVGALLLATAAPAGAQQTTNYIGRSQAEGFKLTVEDQGLTIGFSEAVVQSAPSQDLANTFRDVEGCSEDALVCAQGAGELLLQEAAAAAVRPGQPTDSEETSALDIPDALAPLLTGAIGVARASAQLEPAVARGEGAALQANVTATQTLAETTPLQDTLQTISDALLGPTEGVVPRLKATVDELIDRLEETPILSLTVAPSTSVSTQAGGVTTATARGQGAILSIAPTVADLPTSPEGLIVVEVGAAEATATTVPSPTADADPALARIKVFDPTTQEYDVIEVALGSQCVAENTPLQVCVAVGGADTAETDTGASAKAAGVRIEAFQDPLPQVVLVLAGAEAVVGTELTVAPPPAPPVPVPDLPRTGAGVALPAMVLLGLGGVGLVGLRRRP